MLTNAFGKLAIAFPIVGLWGLSLGLADVFSLCTILGMVCVWVWGRYER